MLELRVLGQFDIQLDGTPIDIASRPAQSLFAFLCCHPDMQHRREKLAGMLWPDSDESNARSNLRHALWRLGESVGKSFFQADKIHIAVNPEADLWVDVRAFESGSDDSLVAARSAVELYQGELLPGFYEDWVELERERLRAVYDRKVERLIALLLDGGRWAAAIQWAERWIAQGHVPESAFRSLMVAYRELGDSAKVANTFERCRTTLMDELGVEPSAETTQLFGRLTRHRAPPQKAPAPRGEGEAAFGAAELLGLDRSWRTWLFEAGTQTFVGREEQMSALNGMLQAALGGSGQLAMIVGEAGSGKTSLAAAFARQVMANEAGPAVAMGHCDVYTGKGDPYAPFRDVLGSLLGDGVRGNGNGHEGSPQRSKEVSPATRWIRERVMAFAPDLVGTMIPQQWLSTASVERGPNASVLSEAVDRVRDATSVADMPTALHRNRVLEAYAEVLVGFSAHRPLLIVLDDLHWIDPSSASLLQFLVNRIQNTPILLLGTYRPDEIGATLGGSQHPLAAVLPDIKRIFGDVWLDVEQTNLDGARRFIDQLLETLSLDVGQDFRDSLAKITRGHPFFVLELIKDLQEQGGLVEGSEGRWVESHELDLRVLPTRVEAVVEDRVSRLDAELSEAASIASVQGDEFVAEVVAEVQGVDPAALVRRLTDELGRAHRLVEEVGIERVHGQLITRFAFRHVLIQKYLYQRLGRGERAYLHEAIGRCLEDIYAESEFPPAGQLARHYAEAGLAAKAAQHLQQAGGQALRVSAYPEAIAHLVRARDLSQSQSAGGPGDGQAWTARLERLLGEAHYGLGDLTESAAHLERAADLLASPVPEGVRRVGFGLAREVLVQAIHLVLGPILLRGTPSEPERLREAAVTYKLLAEIYLVRNETLLTLYATVRGLNMAERSGSAADLARAYADSTVIAPLLRLPRLGEHYRRRALTQVGREGGASAKAYVQLSTSIFTLGVGNWEEALASIRAANEIHEQAGDWNRLGVGLMLLANYFSLRGQNADSLNTYEQLCVLADRSGNIQHLAWGIDGRAKCLIRRGEPEDLQRALELLEDSLSTLKDQGMHQEEVEAFGFLAHAEWRQDHPEAALEAARTASMILGRSAPNFFSQVEGYAAIARTYLSAWEALEPSDSASRDEIHGLARNAVRMLNRLARTFPVCGPRAAIWHAHLDWIDGRRTAAMRGWRQGLRLAAELGVPYEEALAHLELGTHLGSGDPASRTHLDRAADLFARQSVRGDLAIVRSLDP
jgi:DNA-binding SARP family transcriptional activator/tetratricopeptide (TPR) repeat protein